MHYIEANRTHTNTSLVGQLFLATPPSNSVFYVYADLQHHSNNLLYKLLNGDIFCVLKEAHHTIDQVCVISKHGVGWMSVAYVTHFYAKKL